MTSERMDAIWETRLDEVATSIGYPTTPNVGVTVMAAVGRTQTTAPSARGWAPRFAIAAAVVMVILVATLAVPSTRTAVGEFFGLVEGERIEILPTPPPGATPTLLPTAAPIASFGTPFTLEEVATAVGFEPAFVDGEEPEAVYLVDYDGVAVAVLQYEDYDVWQTRTTDYGYFGKVVPVTNVIETPNVGGQFGYWISGGSYIVRFINSDGDEVVGSRRTIDRNVLIWQGPSRTFYRLETSLTLDEALAIGAALP